jgi:LysR family transcriptional regulator, nitrogen assimilation regulatory protein
MDIRHLRYFIAISEEKSLSAASHRLGVAQPSLSQHVIKLEDELGVALIQRSSRGIVLTEDGINLVRHARAICKSMDNCLLEMREAAGSLRGSVVFGLPPSVSMVLSVPLAETVRIELPDVRLQATEAMSGFIRGWIADQTVDLGFLYDINPGDRFTVTHILDETLCFFAPPDNWPLATPPGTPVALADISDLDLVLPSPSHGLRKTVERHAQAIGVNLNVVIEMDAMTQIKELVARGSGYTIFAPAAAHDFVTRGELLKSPITDPAIVRPVYLCTNPEKPRTRAARAVERLTLDVTIDLVRRGIWEGQLSPEISESYALPS